MKAAPGGGQSVADQAAPWRFAQVSTSPYLYRRLTDDAKQDYPPTFFTAIKGCSLSPGASAASAARELLVGLKQLEVEEQKNLTIGSLTALRSLIKAQLEGRPLQLVIYTLKQGECARDYVIWYEINDSRKLAGQELDNQLLGFQAYLGGILQEGGVHVQAASAS